MGSVWTEVVLPMCVLILIAVAVLFGVCWMAYRTDGHVKQEYLREHHGIQVEWQEAARIKLVFDAGGGSMDIQDAEAAK